MNNDKEYINGLIETYYTVKEYADKNKVTEQAIRLAIKENRITAEKIAAVWLIPKNQFE